MSTHDEDSIYVKCNRFCWYVMGGHDRWLKSVVNKSAMLDCKLDTTDDIPQLSDARRYEYDAGFRYDVYPNDINSILGRINLDD